VKPPGSVSLPVAVETWTFWGPAAPPGIVHVSAVLELTTMFVQRLPPMDTAISEEKLVPLTETVAPPDVEPMFGLMALIVGGSAMIGVSPLPPPQPPKNEPARRRATTRTGSRTGFIHPPRAIPIQAAWGERLAIEGRGGKPAL
jgi:hypothetical protein